MNKLDIVKSVVGTVSSLGVGIIAGDIIKNNVATNTTFRKIAVIAGSFAISGAAGSVAREYTDKQIDEIVKMYEDNFKN